MEEPDTPHDEEGLCDADSVGPQTQTHEVVPARRVGRYAVLDEIGSGGMGVVYRAMDVELDRSVALKRPRADLPDVAMVRERILREARAASKLHHPHVVQVFEVFEHEGVPWFAMELVRGKTLKQLIADRGPLSIAEVLRHAEGLSDALAAAHALGILHRDVNPGNILIGDDGRCRLSDFGLTRQTAAGAIDSDGQVSLTGPGLVTGTAGYMSPEQAFGKQLDGRSDLFNVGLVIYEMTTGKRAFPSDGSLEWLDRLVHHEPAPTEHLRPDAPAELSRIIRRCLAKRADDRYPDAVTLRDDLRNLRRRIESGLLVAEIEKARRPWRVVQGAVAAFAVAGIVVVGAAWIARPNDDPLVSLNDWLPTRLTSEAGWEGEPALSPDGTLVAYSTDQSGNPDIWVLDLAGGGEPLQLTDQPSADRGPCWLGDGTGVLYTSERDGEPSIWRVPRLGGMPQRVIDRAADPTISPDGRRIAFARIDGSGFYRIWIAPIDEPEAAIQVSESGDGLWNHRHPAWSPDGRMICYAARRDLWLVSPDGGRPHRLTSSGELDDQPVWTHDSRAVIFESIRQADKPRSYALWRIDADGRNLVRLTLGTGPERQPSLGPRDRRLAYSTYREDANIVVVDREVGHQTRLGTLDWDESPALAPDGSFVVFNSERNGRAQMILQPLVGGAISEPSRELDVDGACVVPSVSPGGRWIACHRVVDGERDIWIVPTDGTPARRFSEHVGVDVNPAFAPSGREIAFASDHDGASHIWVAGFDDGKMVGTPRQLSFGDAQDYHPAWSPDGTEIAFIRYEFGAEDVYVARADGSGPPRRLTSGALVFQVRWLAGDEGLIGCGLWSNGRWSLRRISPSDGRLAAFEPATDLGPLGADALFDLSADGRFLVFTTTSIDGDLWLLDAPEVSK